MRRLSVSVLGATGTVGRASLEVCAQANFSVVALCAGSDIDGLVELCARYRPRFAALADDRLQDSLRRRLHGSGVGSGAGEQAVLDAAAMRSDATVAAISGIKGLSATLTAARRQTKLVLANKECIIAGGSWFMDYCAEHDSPIVPVDSEHNAVFQILERQKKDCLDKIILTASGGPFLDSPLSSLSSVTAQAACAHPNFRMGAKIAIDSATMMNKGLEVIEASWLFSLPEHRIEIAIHPQQIVHGMVSYRDGTIFAHLGACDMRAPLWHGLHWPQRVASDVLSPQRFDWRDIGQLTFRELDSARFPAPKLARASLSSATAPIVLNAANEVVVAAFLARRISFDRIVPTLEQVMQEQDRERQDVPNSLERILTIDGYGRRLATRFLDRSLAEKVTLRRSVSMRSSPSPEAKRRQKAITSNR